MNLVIFRVNRNTDHSDRSYIYVFMVMAFKHPNVFENVLQIHFISRWHLLKALKYIHYSFLNKIMKYLR